MAKPHDARSCELVSSGKDAVAGHRTARCYENRCQPGCAVTSGKGGRGQVAVSTWREREASACTWKMCEIQIGTDASVYPLSSHNSAEHANTYSKSSPNRNEHSSGNSDTEQRDARNVELVECQNRPRIRGPPSRKKEELCKGRQD